MCMQHTQSTVVQQSTQYINIPLHRSPTRQKPTVPVQHHFEIKLSNHSQVLAVTDQDDDLEAALSEFKETVTQVAYEAVGLWRSTKKEQ